MYGVKMLCQRAKISPQTFYRVIKENDEFRELVETCRQKRGNGYLYPDIVLQWLLDYYSISSEPEKSKDAPQEERPVEAPGSLSEPSEAVGREKPLLDKINALEAEIRVLEAKLDEEEQERKSLLMQNGQLLYLLAQEKREKQALLPVPKMSFWERIKGKKERPAE